MATAVHFGAGNIGRGFVAQFLHESGYEVVFADVSDELIGALQQQPSYLVHEIGDGAQDHVVDGYRAINSRTHAADARPLTVIACENAIGGTDILAAEVRKHTPAEGVLFANCAIDRIVPEQD